MEWQPIETVPKDGSSVLIYTEDGIVEATFHKCEHCNDWWHDWNVCAIESYDPFHLASPPTAWMPLPKPPAV